MPVGAIVGSAVVGAGSSAIAGSKNSKAIKKATAAETAANAQSIALQREIYGKNEGYLAPYVKSGIQPNALMAGAMGYGDTAGYQNAFRKFIDNSDYAFQFGEGANKVNSGYAGNGVLQSGAAMKGLEDYRQNLQSGYRGEFNNLLGNQQAFGLSAGSALAGVSTNYANSVSNINSANGNALANAAVAKANNSNATMGGVANALGMVGGVLANPSIYKMG